MVIKWRNGQICVESDRRRYLRGVRPAPAPESVHAARGVEPSASALPANRSRTNGIKTSCLISQRHSDEPESRTSCKLIFLLRQFVALRLSRGHSVGTGERPKLRRSPSRRPGFSGCSSGATSCRRSNGFKEVSAALHNQAVSGCSLRKVELKTPSAFIDDTPSKTQLISSGQRGQANFQVSCMYCVIVIRLIIKTRQ